MTCLIPVGFNNHSLDLFVLRLKKQRVNSIYDING